MSLIVADRVQETTNTTGTGAYTLGGAVAGFQTFASVASDTDTVYYSVTDNVDWEVGLGTYGSGAGTIARTTVCPPDRHEQPVPTDNPENARRSP